MQVHRVDQTLLPPSCIASLACVCMMAACPLLNEKSSYDKKGEVYRLFRRSTHTHTPHTRHTHTHHIHTTDKRITYTSHTRTLYHTNITHVQVFQLISFNSIHSTHLTLVSHVMQVLTCLWLTARLATWRASSISWRVSLFGGYDDLWGSWTAAGKSEPIQSELPGPKGTAPWQSCTMWAKVSIPGFPDDYWQQRGVGHANLGWNPGMFFGWFPVSSLKVGECWAAASTTGSRWRRRLRALCQQHVCGWLHPATIDMFSLAYTYPSLQLLGLSWFPPQWDSTSAWHRGGSMAVRRKPVCLLWPHLASFHQEQRPCTSLCGWKQPKTEAVRSKPIGVQERSLTPAHFQRHQWSICRIARWSTTSMLSFALDTSRYTVMCQWPWWRSSVLTSVSWTTTASTRIA